MTEQDTPITNSADLTFDYGTVHVLVGLVPCADSENDLGQGTVDHVLESVSGAFENAILRQLEYALSILELPTNGETIYEATHTVQMHGHELSITETWHLGVTVPPALLVPYSVTGIDAIRDCAALALDSEGYDQAGEMLRRASKLSHGWRAARVVAVYTL